MNLPKIFVFMYLCRHKNEEGKKLDPKERISFDARYILGQFDSLDFGECKLEGLRLSQRDAEDEDGYYKTLASLNFP
jgi:hypothetical protein